ncbi:MAG TPA: carboxypeptidase regulatory-like domain-containing protein [Terriglobales bacterium]|nr:carboxypeptidase regulatory-like domain-containing protein [Terriglobales bacterium]
MRISPATLLLCVAFLPLPSVAGTIEGQVHRVGPAFPAGKDYVISVEDVAERPVRVTATIDQKNLNFVPHVLAVQRGTTVQFPNSDPLKHNVFSISPAKRFNLGMYSQGESRSVTFDQVGIVELLCNVHLEMSAFIVVVANRYFAQAGSDGRFRIAGVPAGHHRLRCWQENIAPQYLDVEVPAEGTVQVEFTIPAGAREAGGE